MGLLDSLSIYDTAGFWGDDGGPRPLSDPDEVIGEGDANPYFFDPPWILGSVDYLKTFYDPEEWFNSEFLNDLDDHDWAETDGQ